MTIQLAMMKRYIESCWFDKENNRGQGFLLVFVCLLVVFHVTDKSLLDKAHDRSFVVRNTYYNTTYLDLNICRQFHGESYNESFFYPSTFYSHTHTPHKYHQGTTKVWRKSCIIITFTWFCHFDFYYECIEYPV